VCVAVCVAVRVAVCVAVRCVLIGQDSTVCNAYTEKIRCNPMYLIKTLMCIVSCRVCCNVCCSVLCVHTIGLYCIQYLFGDNSMQSNSPGPHAFVYYVLQCLLQCVLQDAL